jgi:nucleoside-diphosphate-sugar epimerase
LERHDRIALSGADWREAVASADFRGATVFHLAARVHQAGAHEADFEADNTDKTKVLAEAAAVGGALRFVFASTVKVHGEETGARPFRADDVPRPADGYARSKWHAEEALREVGRRAGLPFVVVRIPLTWGPGAGGNFRALLRLADSRAWLPFAWIDNRRSLVHVDDLAQALLVTATHDSAPGRTFLVAHPQPVSTPGLVEAMRAALGRPCRLFGMPRALLEGAAALSGQGARMRRLTRSLEVDPGPLISDLRWVPRVDLVQGLESVARAWRTEIHR